MKNIGDDIEKADSKPYKDKMRAREFDRYDDYYDHWPKAKISYNKIERFIRAHVGKSYNKTYQEFCDKIKNDKDWVANVGEWSATKAFEDLFSDRHITTFEIKNGIIKEIPRAYKKPKPEIMIAYGTVDFVVYNKEYESYYPNIKNIMYDCLGSKITNVLVNEEIPYEQFEKIKNSNNVKYKFTDTLYKMGFKKIPNNKYSNYLTFDDLFRYLGANSTTIKKGDNNYKQIKAEQNDAYNKFVRKSKKEKEERTSEILYQIEAKRKAEIIKDNEITRDRMGFNEESFKGEFYHGQKRKKKNR